jgi:hypothetical protein
LTEELVDARKALSVAKVSGAQIIALIHACDVATAMLPELSNALLDAKGRLAGMAPSDGETSKSG